MLTGSVTTQAQTQKEDKSTGQEIKDGAKKAGEEVKDAGKEVGKGAKKAGKKTAEISSKGASKIADQQLKDRVGPDGQTVYVDGHSRYYWVDNSGRHVYVEESKLKAK